MSIPVNASINQYRGGIKWDLQLSKRLENPIYLESHGYKVYSQNDEDGIIQEIFRRIGTTNKKFIEFGVQHGLECNSHYLLHKKWFGMWIEASTICFEQIQSTFRSVIENSRLKVVNSFITIENVNEIFINAGFTGEIDLLSIDIDGNDYHVWEAVNVVNPRVVIVEYNAKFPDDCEWVMPYKADYSWDYSDKQGASLKSLESLGAKKGYCLVGTNLNGVNAFFVRNDLVNDLFPLPATSENLYNPPRWNYTWRTGHPPKQCLVEDDNHVNEPFANTRTKNNLKIASENIKSRKVLIWGMGKGFESLKKFLPLYSIGDYVYFDSQKSYSRDMNKESILQDLSLLTSDKYYVIVTCFKYYSEIESELLKRGFVVNTDYIFANL